MQYNIEIQPSGVHYKSNENILNDALSQSVPLEHSCKTGECGACSAEILSGVIENEKGEQVKSGTILTCQSKAISDVVLKANYYPELVHIKQQTLPCKVASFDLVTDDIIIIKLRFPPTAKFDYLPGQYVDLSYKGIKRSYSIANAHSNSKELELHVRKVPQGKMSELLFGRLKVNELMRMEGPKGTFFIRNSNKALILLAGGTGIAPIKAIVEELIAKRSEQIIHIYWGMNEQKSFYLPALEKLAEQYSNIFFIPVLSGTELWDGRMGFVHQAIIDDFDSLATYDVYACGSPLMINAAKQDFISKELPEESFFSDAFTPAKTI
jgi:CDP-4-dehydro-6-deoxyglucose reductase